MRIEIFSFNYSFLKEYVRTQHDPAVFFFEKKIVAIILAAFELTDVVTEDFLISLIFLKKNFGGYCLFHSHFYFYAFYKQYGGFKGKDSVLKAETSYIPNSF